MGNCWDSVGQLFSICCILWHSHMMLQVYYKHQMSPSHFPAACPLPVKKGVVGLASGHPLNSSPRASEGKQRGVVKRWGMSTTVPSQSTNSTEPEPQRAKAQAGPHPGKTVRKEQVLSQVAPQWPCGRSFYKTTVSLKFKNETLFILCVWGIEDHRSHFQVTSLRRSQNMHLSSHGAFLERSER